MRGSFPNDRHIFCIERVIALCGRYVEAYYLTTSTFNQTSPKPTTSSNFNNWRETGNNPNGFLTWNGPAKLPGKFTAGWKRTSNQIAVKFVSGTGVLKPFNWNIRQNGSIPAIPRRPPSSRLKV